MRDVIEIIEVQLLDKLNLASSKLPQLRQDSVDSLDSLPSSLCSSEDILDVRSPTGTLERGPRPRPGAVSKTRSLPRGKYLIDFLTLINCVLHRLYEETLATSKYLHTGFRRSWL